MIHTKLYGIESHGTYPENIRSLGDPSFTKYKENIAEIKIELENYQKFSNIIVIGHGGSISTFAVYVRALKGNGKKVFLLNTNEIDLINNIKNEYTKLNTVVVCISKSGTNITNLEAVLQFSDYPVIVVTENIQNALGSIAEYYGWKIIKHPPLGGRFSGFSASSFVPALLFGLPVDRIQKGAQEMYALCSINNKPNDNPAWKIASALHRLELVGKDEIYVALYSYYLETTIPLIMQLVHETTGKEGKGWTVIGAVGPESQHHTNQRYFGGKNNMVGVFATVNNQRDKKTSVSIPHELQHTKIREGTLTDIDNVSLSKSLLYEFEGTKQDALQQKIPFIHIELEKLDSQNVAQFIALWHMIVYYLARLINVDPFSQPQVENSKEISFQLRKNAQK
ncbi:hypothetical protein AUK41_01215 [Candidatus Berkelbacteria bacterium CG2_30_43_20]|nr:MAG: hypothetical protein AUK41_01215 [Candidatus Berkelbacteria bacterium CG2_30_43_20]